MYVILIRVLFWLVRWNFVNNFVLKFHFNRILSFFKFCSLACKLLNNFVVTRIKRLQNFKPILLVILWAFDLGYHYSFWPSPRDAFFMFGFFFMKFRKLKSLLWGKEEVDLHKMLAASLFESFPVLQGINFFQIL